MDDGRKKQGDPVMILIAVLFTAATLLLAWRLYIAALPGMDSEFAFRYGYFVMAALMLDVVMLTSSITCKGRQRSQRLFFGIQAVGVIDLMSTVFSALPEAGYQMTVIAMVVIYLVSPFESLLFWLYQRSVCPDMQDSRHHPDGWIIAFCAADCAFLIAGCALGRLFMLDENMVYHKGAWNPYTYICPFFVLVCCIIANLRCPTRSRIHTACIVYALLPILLALIALCTGNTIFSHSAQVFGCLVIYAGVHVNTAYESQLREKQLQETTINAAILQINPHFIQNCLTSIRDLMYLDRKAADTMLVELAGYLRKTYTNLHGSGLIPVREEMALVDFYLKIEQMRYPGMFRVERRIDLPELCIPAFSIEPLVENAVRHGIREKAAPGTIRIHVCDLGTAVEICVADDGVGFDVHAEPTDGRKHVGLQNVRTRIALMSKGELVIESRPGQGTSVRILLPKKRE